MICIAFGSSVAISNQNNSTRTVDFSITGSEENVKEAINSLNSNYYIENFYSNAGFYSENFMKEVLKGNPYITRMR